MDSALHYYKEADSLAIKLGSNLLRMRVNGEFSAYYTQLGMYKEAYKCLQWAFLQFNSDDRAPAYSTVAHYYLNINQLDSALIYFTKLLKMDDYLYLQSAYKGLGEIATKRGNYAEACSYWALYEMYRDSVQSITQTETVRKINALYNYQLREEENNRLQMQNRQQKNYIVWITASMVVVVALFFAYRQNRKRKEEGRINQLQKLKALEEQKYRQSQEFIEENKKRIAELEKELQASKIVQNQPQQELLHARKQSLEKDNEQVEAYRRLEAEAVKALETSDIFRKCHEVDGNLSAEDWQTLTAAIDSTYSQFTHRLKDLYPVSEVELQVCLLLKIGISSTRIAQLVLRSKQAVTSIRKRLYKKVFSQEGTPDEWDKFIRNY